MDIPCLFILSYVDRHLGCFYLLFTMNRAATTNIHRQGFVRMCVVISPGHVPRRRTAKSYGNSMFNLLRKGSFSKAAALFQSHQLYI